MFMTLNIRKKDSNENPSYIIKKIKEIRKDIRKKKNVIKINLE